MAIGAGGPALDLEVRVSHLSRRVTGGDFDFLVSNYTSTFQTQIRKRCLSVMTRTNFPSSLSENYYYDADNNLSAGCKYSPRPLTSKVDCKGQTIAYFIPSGLQVEPIPDTTR